MSGQWAIHYGPLYEIFIVYGHIYLYGHNTIVHTCLHWYNSMTMRQKENDIEEKDGRERNQGERRSFLAANGRIIEITFDTSLYFFHSPSLSHPFSFFWSYFLLFFIELDEYILSIIVLPISINQPVKLACVFFIFLFSLLFFLSF